MKVLDLYSGLGAFSLGLERAGMKTIAFCEIESFARKIIKKNWPGVPVFENVETISYERLASAGLIPDVICGGFPCQDISYAGKGAGIEGERSGLWKEYARIIREFMPSYALMENVSALLRRGLDTVLSDLAQIGYDAEWHCIPASHLGAQHIRDRIWIIAYPSRVRFQGKHKRYCKIAVQGPASTRRKIGRAYAERTFTYADIWGQELSRTLGRIRREQPVSGNGYWKTTSEPFVCRGNHGIANRMDRLRALGNAVVPHIPEAFGRAILEKEAGR